MSTVATDGRSGNSDERIQWIGACLVVLPAAAPSRDEPLQDKYQYQMGREISRSLPNDFLFVVLGLLSPHCVWWTYVLLECSFIMISLKLSNRRLNTVVRLKCWQEIFQDPSSLNVKRKDIISSTSTFKTMSMVMVMSLIIDVQIKLRHFSI